MAGIKGITGKYKRSEEQKARLRIIGRNNKGKKRTKEAKEKYRIAKLGKKHPLEWRLRRSERQKGSNSHLWKGGLTNQSKIIRSSASYKIWREAVFKRDNYICIWCGKRGGKLNADHIKPFSLFPELRFAIDNGRTLCHECHKKTESYGWKFNKLIKNQKPQT